jgi:hypothetical protein
MQAKSEIAPLYICELLGLFAGMVMSEFRVTVAAPERARALIERQRKTHKIVSIETGNRQAARPNGVGGHYRPRPIKNASKSDQGRRKQLT